MAVDLVYQDTTDELISIARDALFETRNTEARIDGIPLSEVPNIKERKLDHTVTKPTLTPPPAFSDLFPEGDDALDHINKEVEEWFGHYFPNLNDCFTNVPEEWLCKVIGGDDPLGNHAPVFNQVWEDARGRARLAQEDELARLRREYSSRGFVTPPGAYFAALDRSNQRLNEELREVNTAQAVKDVELKASLLQTAVSEAARIKTAMMSALADITRAMADASRQGVEKARVRAQAMSSFYSAMSQYYNVEVAFEELILRSKEASLNAGNASDSLKIDAFSARGSVVGQAAQALGQAARAFASIAEGAAGSAGTLVAQVE